MAHTHGDPNNSRLSNEIQDGPELHYHTDEHGNRTSSEPNRPGHRHIHLGVFTSPEIPIYDPDTRIYFKLYDTPYDKE